MIHNKIILAIKKTWRVSWIITFGFPSILHTGQVTTSTDGNIEPGVCALKNNVLTVSNDGKTVGMVEVGLTPAMSSQKTALLVNAEKGKPDNSNKKQLHLGYGSGTQRQKLLFRGQGKVVCYECGTTANDPNDQPMCTDPKDINNCLKCSNQTVDCAKMVTINRCHAAGEPWASQAEYEKTEGQKVTPKKDLAIRLELIKEPQKESSTKK